MAASNLDPYRAGHHAFNDRDFQAMTRRYADSIRWTDRATGRTFRTPRGVPRGLPGRVGPGRRRHPHRRPRYLDADQTVVCTFTVAGTHDGPLGSFPATGRRSTLPLCELWHFDTGGRVVGGDLYYDYYDQVSILTQLGLLPLASPAG